MKEIVYTLTAQIEGKSEDECEAGEKGAGEARKFFEQQIERMKVSADSTDIKTISLIEN